MYIDNKIQKTIRIEKEYNQTKHENKELNISEDGRIIQKKSLLDYLILSDKEKNIFPCEIYKKDLLIKSSENKKEFIKKGLVELNDRKEAEENINFEKNGEFSDYWFKNKHGTPQFHWDSNKLNYLIRFWMDNGSNLEKEFNDIDYPSEFEEDDNRTKEAYRFLARKAGKAISECCLLKTFKELELDDASITVDWKGEFSVESENKFNKDQFDKMFNDGWDIVRVFRDLMPKCSKMRSMSSEEKQDFMEATGYRWDLYRKYNLRAEDLKIKDNGEIEGLNEKFLEEYGTDFDKPYYDIYRRAIRCGGDSDEIMVTMVVKNGKLFIN